MKAKLVLWVLTVTVLLICGCSNCPSGVNTTSPSCPNYVYPQSYNQTGSCYNPTTGQYIYPTNGYCPYNNGGGISGSYGGYLNPSTGMCTNPSTGQVYPPIEGHC